jgi:hypothetical protein
VITSLEHNPDTTLLRSIIFVAETGVRNAFLIAFFGLCRGGA